MVGEGGGGEGGEGGEEVLGRLGVEMGLAEGREGGMGGWGGGRTSWNRL